MSDTDARNTRLRPLGDSAGLVCDWGNCWRYAFCERARRIPPHPARKGAWPLEWLPVCLTHAICDVEGRVAVDEGTP